MRRLTKSISFSILFAFKNYIFWDDRLSPKRTFLPGFRLSWGKKKLVSNQVTRFRTTYGAPFGLSSVHGCHISLTLYMKYDCKIIPVVHVQVLVENYQNILKYIVERLLHDTWQYRLLHVDKHRNNKDILYINSLLNTKVKIKEPYKKRSTIQCTVKITAIPNLTALILRNV
ncbi:hypothetical protein AGLY_012226 [Aphis glycines]|uniref:Uncharacterized protein n=1 Tax=Aphis glycines TaxID=307491 RepID=A0A6G0TAT7_APHGL|nr:hypothetical protein AGLY_012226 [Aphis glycines]